MRAGNVHVFGLSLVAFAAVLAASTFFVSGKAQTSPAGKELFEKRCGGCHALDRDKEGPRLQGVYGRTAGSVDSFQYSDALKKSGIKWNSETLEKWLTDTDKLVPGNDMTFRVEKAEERREIIAWLQQTSN